MRQKTDILKRFYSKLATSYDEVVLSEEARWIAPNKINEYIESFLMLNMSILDIGVGTGQSIDLPYKLGCSVTGLDLSSEMIEIVQTAYPKGSFMVADIEEKWPIKKTYDVIIASGVLEFIEDINFVISEAQTHLKTDGHFIFTFEKLLPNDQLQQYKEAELGKGLVDKIPEALSFRVYRRTEEELINLLTKNDFKINKTGEFISYYKKDGDYPVTYGIILAQKQ